jgi:putative FmdB family regulatory protein
MPVYEYVCRDCKKEFEVVKAIHDAGKKAACPKCKSTQTERQWSRVSVETSRKS